MRRKKENRVTVVQLTLRLTPNEAEEITRAIHSSPEAWMGKSHFVRQAALHWARGVNSQVNAGRLGAIVKKASGMGKKAAAS